MWRWRKNVEGVGEREVREEGGGGMVGGRRYHHV